VLILQGCRTTNNGGKKKKKCQDELNNNELNWKSIDQLPISTKKVQITVVTIQNQS